jgi:hypothetical protein
MIFGRETLHDFFKLPSQTMEAMKLHQRLHLIHNVDERELKLAYSSGNQNLLVVQCATHGEKATVTIAV